MIKNVVIKNFMCFSEYVSLCFDDGLNIITGKRGSGKTSFYNAIQWACGRPFFYDYKKFPIYNINSFNALLEEETLVVDVEVEYAESGITTRVCREERYLKRKNHALCIGGERYIYVDGKKQAIQGDIIYGNRFADIIWDYDMLRDLRDIIKYRQMLPSSIDIVNAEKIANKYFGNLYFRDYKPHIYITDTGVRIEDRYECLSEEDELFFLLCVWKGINDSCMEIDEKSSCLLIEGGLMPLSYGRGNILQKLWNDSEQVILSIMDGDAEKYGWKYKTLHRLVYDESYSVSIE